MLVVQILFLKINSTEWLIKSLSLILTLSFLTNVRVKIVSNYTASAIILLLVWCSNVSVFFTPKFAQIPSFFFFMTTIVQVLPNSAFFLVGKQTGMIFTVMNMMLYTTVFFQSVGQTADFVFTKDQHFKFLTTIIVQQIYSVVLNHFFQIESGISHELFEKILKTLQRNSQEKTNFISRMSHELRTPLHGMLSSVDLLKNTSMDEEQSTYLSAIDSCGGLLLDTIVKILDISQIESGKFHSELSSFSLYSLIQSVIDSVSILATRKNIDINVNFNFHPFGFDVNGDQVHLKEIILNVIFFFFFFFFSECDK